MKDESHPKEEEKNSSNHASKTNFKGPKDKEQKPAKGEKKGGKKNG